jgi:CBS domain-containing protein
MIEAIVANQPGGVMQVREGMSGSVLTIGPHHTLADAATAMCRRNVGAAVVLDPDAPGPGVITERDILHAVGRGQDPDQELVGDHLTSNLTFAAPDWSLEQAAAAMVRGHFRHLIVVDGGELAGILSIRDIVRVWTQDGASCEVPASPDWAAATPH